MYDYKAKLHRVIDGDTFDFLTDVGLDIRGVMTRVRLKDVDAPETFGVKKGCEEWIKGTAATEWAKAWFEQHGHDVMLYTFKDKKGSLRRWLGKIVAYDGACFNDELAVFVETL